MTRYLYLVETVDGKHTKIGITNRPASRTTEIQHGCPIRVIRRYLFDCNTFDAERIEKRLKLRFAKYRVHGEWFALPAEKIMWAAVETEWIIMIERNNRPPRIPDDKAAIYIRRFFVGAFLYAWLSTIHVLVSGAIMGVSLEKMSFIVMFFVVVTLLLHSAWHMNDVVANPSDHRNGHSS